MEASSFNVILHPDPEGGYLVSVPALPEVATQGDTREEALENAREAVALALEHRRTMGEPVPGDVELDRVTVAA